ncbi:MAG: hypothetical protein ACO2OU_02680 [Thermus aquaticus]|uniref:hypothetical protein n=1 Tax=Thermus aquaticus TaxID=271 RepID=UPI003BFF51F9
MRKLVAVLVLALGLASAQGRLFGEALGGQIFLVPSFGALLTGQAGAERILGPLDARVGLTLGLTSSLVVGGLNLDVLYGIPLDGLKADVGAGFGVLFAGSATLFSLRGLVGLEVPLQGALAVRVEPTLTYNVNSQTVGLAVNLGPRVYLGK